MMVLIFLQTLYSRGDAAHIFIYVQGGCLLPFWPSWIRFINEVIVNNRYYQWDKCCYTRLKICLLLQLCIQSQFAISRIPKLIQRLEWLMMVGVNFQSHVGSLFTNSPHISISMANDTGYQEIFMYICIFYTFQVAHHIGYGLAYAKLHEYFRFGRGQLV